MQFQTKSKSPHTPAPGQAIERVIDSVLDAAQNGRLTEAARAAISLGQELTRAQKNLQKIDGAMKNLDKQVPGVPEAVSEAAAIFKDLVQTIPAANVPNGLRPLAKDLNSTAAAFAKFNTDYETYLKTPNATWWKPWTWGAKSSAGLEAQTSWNNFMKSYDQLKTHLPAKLRNPALHEAARQVLEGAFDAAGQILK